MAKRPWFGTRMHDRLLEYIDALAEEGQERHKEHMAEWRHFKTDEYQEELRDAILAQTHEDILPPWFSTDIETGDEEEE